MATKSEIIKDMKKYCDNAGVITKSKFMKYMGKKDPRQVDQYLQGLPRFNGKDYFIGDIAEKMVEAQTYD